MIHRTRHSLSEAPIPRYGSVAGGPRRSTRSIAIKRNRRTASEYEEMADSTAYEMATWRMYNRIINHRMNNQTSEGSTSSDEDNFLAIADYQDPTRSVSDASPPVTPKQSAGVQNWRTTDDDIDEGIFQLDL